MNSLNIFNKNKTVLALAPMDGVLDYNMREVLTQILGIDFCVSEFLRVTNTLYPDKVFYEVSPELKTQGINLNNVPVFFQLLGSDSEMIYKNAQRAISLGAKVIDLNFGCPAKVVNNHNGGAALLKSPNEIYKIINKLKVSLPSNITISAKMRLGYETPNHSVDIAKGMNDAGIDWITVHCRTKLNGYKPPAFWEWIPKIKRGINVPIIVNGDIFTLNDYIECKKITENQNFMIGRGALYNPFIFHEIRNYENTGIIEQLEPEILFTQLKKMIFNFYLKALENENSQYAISRTKQWLKFTLSSNKVCKYFLPIFETIKIINSSDEFKSKLDLF